MSHQYERDKKEVTSKDGDIFTKVPPSPPIKVGRGWASSQTHKRMRVRRKRVRAKR